MLIETISARRSGSRQEDVLDAVVYGEVAGNRLSDDEIIALVTQLLFGGLGTTSAALAGMILWLADHPDDQHRLRDHVGLRISAIDEFIRWTSPVAHIGRTLTSDTRLHGCPMEAGERVLLSFGSANRDTTVFDRADEVLVDRHPNRHIAFGMGPHRCVGSHLAKLQMSVALDELLDSLPDFRIADYTGIRWAAGQTRLISNLPISVGGTA